MGSWRKPAKAAETVAEVAHRLTDRDRAIIAELDRFKLLTLEQVRRLFFTSISSARDRLSTLVEQGVLARSRPTTRSAYRYYLGPLGLRLVHADRVTAYERSGLDPYGKPEGRNPGRAPTPAKAREHAEAVFFSTQRPHREGVNDFYTRLVASCRTHPAARFLMWDIEKKEHRWHTAIFLRPDGIFDLALEGLERPFWFEFDTGTETLERLAEKARRFSAFIERHLKMPWTLPLMLIELTKPGREDNLHTRLAQLDAVYGVATTVTARSANPLDRIWRVYGDEVGILRSLAEIKPPNH